MSADKIKRKLEQAKELIKAKEYEAARKILVGVKHPTAKKWVKKIDTILSRREAPKTIKAPSIGVNWTLANEGAAAWAETHVGDTLAGLDKATQKAIQKELAEYWRKDDQTMRGLIKRLEAFVDTTQAETIATTETTRAGVQAKLALIAQLREQGAKVKVIWQTANDAHVCATCASRNQTKQGEAWTDPPPAHDGCRCWISFGFADIE